VHCLALGLTLTVAPLYINELTPLERRAAVGSLEGAMLDTGMLVSFALGIGTDLANPEDETYWRFLILFPVIVNMIQLTLMKPVLIDSPRFLIVLKNQEQEGINSLCKIYKKEYVKAELEVLRNERKIQYSPKLIPFIKKFWRPLLIGINLAIVQQFSGAPVFDFYSNQLFLETTLDMQNTQIYTTLMGVTNLVAAYAVTFTVHKFSAKKVFLIGLLLSTLNLVALGVTFHLHADVASRVLILTYTFIYNSSLGSAVYILIPEFLPASGCIIAYTWSGISLFVASFTFLYIRNTKFGSPEAFFIYAGFSLLVFIHACFELPETKNKTFQEAIGFFGIYDEESAKVVIEVTSPHHPNLPGVPISRGSTTEKEEYPAAYDEREAEHHGLGDYEVVFRASQPTLAELPVSVGIVS